MICTGLPIEVRVEQDLDSPPRKISRLSGLRSLSTHRSHFALKNKDVMSGQFKKLRVWLDFENPYQTIQPGYIEAAWWTIQRASERGCSNGGSASRNWCPRCATAIADAEVEYWEETDPSIFVKFPLAGKSGESFVIWTTTPWTLPANVAVAVSPRPCLRPSKSSEG